jgi:hypothetical protein
MRFLDYTFFLKRDLHSGLKGKQFTPIGADEKTHPG